MTNITATGVGNTDVENLFNGVLTVVSTTPTQFVLSRGTTLTVNGTGFTYSGTAGLTGGTITSVDETDAFGNHQHWDGFSIPATSVISGLQIDLNNFHNLFFGGNDTITFNPGKATSSFSDLLGFGGNDVINYNADWTGLPGYAKTIDGGDGNDTLNLNAGFTTDDSSLVQEGFTNFYVSNIETVRLSAGHDYKIAAPDHFAEAGTTVTVDGSAVGAGNVVDFVGMGVQGNLILKGGAGDDLFEGGYGNDIFDGGSGSDTVRLQIGPDYASGLGDEATVDLNLTTPQVVSASRGSDTFISIENLIGTQSSDHLTGNAADNVLDVGTGGIDFLDGGAGNDTASFAHLLAGHGATVNLAVTGIQVFGYDPYGMGTVTSGVQLTSIENLIGSNSDDSLTGDSGNNVLTGNAGNDTLRGSGGMNTLDGGLGSDTAAFALAPGNYYVTSTATGYQIQGPGETDTLTNIEQTSFDATGQTLSLSQFVAGSFNPLVYIASYADLIKGAGDNQVAGTQHYMQHGYYEGRTATFSALQYIASYSDLIKGLGDNTDAALEHYILHGYYEGRTPTFSALDYIASYSDLIQNVGDNQQIALDHYILHGYSEGRTANFNTLQYIASYSDLITTYGDNQNAALEQYIQHGYHDGRTPSFNALEYVASNPDLIRGAGENQTIALEHYILHGYYEGRSATSFDALEYIASNTDLIPGAGTNQAIGIDHYILHGYSEGRSTNSFDPVAYLLTNNLGQAYTAQTATAQYIQTGFYQGNSSSGAFGAEQTNHALTLGAQTTDRLTNGDKDWFSINLTAGQSYDLTLSGATSGGMSDPFLELHNANGVLVTQDNDSGPGTDALIHVTAASTGTYYLVAASNVPGGTGNYKILAASA